MKSHPLPPHHQSLPLRLLLAAGLLAGLATASLAREVRVGVYHNPPKISLGQNGQPTGILGDLLQEVARQNDWTLVPVTCEWQACLEATQRGQIDLMPDVAYNEQRAQVMSFPEVPALHSWSQVFRR